MVSSLLAAERIIAATYAHNQNYFNQRSGRATGSNRFERPPTDTPYRAVAEEVAGLVRAATEVKRQAFGLDKAFMSAEEAVDGLLSNEAGSNKSGKNEILRQMKRLTDSFNEMQERALAAEGYLGAAAKRNLTLAADGFSSIGITRRPDGSVRWDEDQFVQALQTRFEQTRRTAAGPFGLTEWLKRTVEPLDQVTTYSLLNKHNRDLHAFTSYRPAAGLYLQLPPAGILLDASF